MPSFLSTCLHWLWVPFHWMRHDVYAPWTFGTVVFIGFAQTAIAWESGELAVKALSKDLLSNKDRRRYLRFVRFLAILVFPATIFVGVVNDKSQRDADDRAARARTDGLVVQSKLNEANERAKHAQESFNAFAKSLDPSKLTVAQYVKLVQANQDAAGAAGVTPSHEIEGSFSSLSNVELRDAISKFVGKVGLANLKMYGMEDEIGREQRAIQMASLKQSEIQNLRQSLQANQQALGAFITSIVQSDVPIANSYLSELLRRLGPQKEQIVSFTADPSVGSINSFTERIGYLEVLASRLSDLEQRVTTTQR